MLTCILENLGTEFSWIFKIMFTQNFQKIVSKVKNSEQNNTLGELFRYYAKNGHHRVALSQAVLTVRVARKNKRTLGEYHIP